METRSSLLVMALFRRRDAGWRAFDLSQVIAPWLKDRVTGSQQPRTQEDFQAAARELIDYTRAVASKNKERDPAVVTKAISLQRAGGSIGFGPGVDVLGGLVGEVAKVAVDLLLADGAVHPDSERLRALKTDALRQIREHNEGK